MSMTLFKKFVATIEKHNMLTAGDSVLISLSGGVDSTVMTHLFAKIKKRYDLMLYAFHLNHKLRPDEAKAEAEFVRDLCDKLEIQQFIMEHDVKGYAKKSGLSVQHAARNLRYDYMDSIQRERCIDKVATAHNADDRVETVFIRMLRGTVGAGAVGMKPVKDGYIIRPLIDVFKAEIESFAKERGMDFMTDSSNSKPVYLRNKVRLELIPYLAKNYNNNISQGILNFAKGAALEDDFIRREAELKYKEALLAQSDESISLNLTKLMGVDRALLNRILITAYYKLARPGDNMTYTHIVKINYIMEDPKPNLSYKLPGGVTVYKSYNVLGMTSVSTNGDTTYEYEHRLGDTTNIAEVGITIKSKLIRRADIHELIKNKRENEEYVDAGRLTFPITIRSFRAGDIISPLNMRGSKKLKDLFIDKKVSVRLRRRIPVLTSNGDIFLIPNVCISNKIKITNITDTAVRFTFF